MKKLTFLLFIPLLVSCGMSDDSREQVMKDKLQSILPDIDTDVPMDSVFEQVEDELEQSILELEDEMEKAKNPKLKTTVTFTGNQFVITNGGDYTYRNTTMRVNVDYVLRNVTLVAGETYTVNMVKFTDMEGNSFNTTMKPESFSINCAAGSYLTVW